MVDCGLFQGLKDLRIKNWRSLPLTPQTIDTVLLTHAHIDHSGYLPLLVKNGFKGQVLTTGGTKALCKILLPDAGHLQEEDAAFANRHEFSKHHPALPLYTEEDAIASLNFLQDIPWKEKISLAKNASCSFSPAGHIIGASIIQIENNGRKITFSGDLGRSKDLTMKPPSSIQETDYLVVESTYGDRCHPTEDPLNSLKEIINRTMTRGGILLIPAFAVGRAQQMLYLISELKKRKQIDDIPVYLNSPMAIQATQVSCNFSDETILSEAQCRSLCDVARFVTTMDESRTLNALGSPAIIISASGMATGGRVLHHLKFLASNPQNTILFVGFQAAGTRGEALTRGNDHIKIHGIEIPVHAEVVLLETLSAHADANELMAWLKGFRKAPKMTFITHGEPPAAAAFKKHIEEQLGWHCTIPNYLDRFELT